MCGMKLCLDCALIPLYTLVQSGTDRLCISGATCILSYGTLVYFAYRDLNSVGMAPTFIF